MHFSRRRTKYYLLSFLKYDLKASITVFFVALPLCLGIALASNAPAISGLMAGIIGGLIIPLISRSELSVSGPAAGLTAICAAAIVNLGSLEYFFLSIAIAGFLQVALGVLKLGGISHFIPSSVIKGMLAAIGIILMAKQIPTIIGYDKPDFWSGELFNIVTFNHAYSNIRQLYQHTSLGTILISTLCLAFLFISETVLSKKLSFLPGSFLVVVFGILLSHFAAGFSSLRLADSQYVNLPPNVLSTVHIQSLNDIFINTDIWKNACIICFVATLETLLSVAAIDKLDPYNRITPQNRELVAQGTGNFFSGLFGGLPITAVIVRSAANVEAGGKTRLSAFFHGILILLAIMVGVKVINMIPLCVLGVILLRTGYNLAKPGMLVSVYRQGREQFLPFVVTIIAILITDLLIGVLIGIGYAIYFLIKHTYRAGFIITEFKSENRFLMELALNVSFLNKKKISEALDAFPEKSRVEINGSKSVYIDHDVLEIFQDFRSKASARNIDLALINIPEVETIEMH